MALVLLCVAIVLQVLGVPITFFDPVGAEDPAAASVLEGLTLPVANASSDHPRATVFYNTQSGPQHRQLLISDRLDRPPESSSFLIH